MTTPQTVEAKPVEQAIVRQEQPQALAPQSLTPAQMLSIAVQQGADTQKLKELMDLQERWQRDQARQAYAQAIVQFRAKCPTIKRTGKAGFEGKNNSKIAYTYAQLPQAIEQIQKLMDDCQLAATWVTPEQSEKSIKVTCTVTHVLGHSESTSLAGPPDMSGSKNQLQAIKSTWTYLRRVTLFSLLGLVDKDEVDDDGAGGKPQAEPPKPQSPADPEAETKKAFWNAAQKKAGVKFTMQQIQSLFARVQQASGKQSAAECLDHIQRDDVVLGKDGSVTSVPDGTEDAPVDADFENAEGDSLPFQCDECPMRFKVKPASHNNQKGERCFGEVKEVT